MTLSIIRDVILHTVFGFVFSMSLSYLIYSKIYFLEDGNSTTITPLYLIGYAQATIYTCMLYNVAVVIIINKVYMIYLFI